MNQESKENICQEIVFQHVYNTHVKDLNNYLYYKYGDQYNPSDKAQDAFIKLWDNCKKVTISKAKAYLFKVANNLMLNEIKHQKVVLKYQQINHSQHDYETPEFLIEKDQYLESYKKVLENLSEEQRVAFLLNKVDGKKHSEIADMLGVTKKVIEYRIYSAFKILKSELENFSIK
ncbi:RNA polymerase sigma factor [Xanthomarina spongicola]|uniref:RNA polymerase sigma-70 factor (ECF subfamily) n=1 Tax=Xanthomarina spongicola TaxID=570520 RepID=A0A316DNH0_9FLAO|nr:sigma-70 family RNA polymerase sigma factor [Xanthomarina spongicola]PWK19601.1 RNA polymerase sigma-70 factor (ECF subfamily) [Xanthomarina spongicola]